MDARAERPRKRPTELGEHEVVRLVAEGGMGAVYEVRHRRTGARYAAKTILKASDPTARARFEREAELMARCDRHPGVVKVHAQGATPEGDLYIILDFIEGENLEKLVAREGRLEPRRAATLARDVAVALGFMHERGVVHRDVKPANVLLDAAAGGAPKLTDFGLATARDTDRLTKSGAFLGTIAYCAPEQMLGKRDLVGPWTNVFSTGALLFAMLAGRPPAGETGAAEAIARLHSDEPFPDVRELAPEVPAPLAAIVAKAVSKEPAERYPDGAALAGDLEAFLAGEPVSALGPAARRSVLPALGALALLSAAFLGLALAVAARRAPAAATDTPVASSPEARLARARELLAARKLDEAAREAAAVEALLPPARRSEAAELLGDVRVAAEKPAAAVEDYTRALQLASERPLKLAPERASELRLKRGAAASLAGDDRKALEDFARLVVNVGSLPDDRKANEKLAPFASPLYRRGLREGTTATRERDLETAARLAPPPRDLASAVARFWREGVSAFPAVGDPTKAYTLATVESLKPWIRRWRRALELDPGIDAEPLWVWIGAGLSTLHTSEMIPKPAVANALLAIWPDHPYLLFVAANSRGLARDAVDPARRAVAIYPAPVPGENETVAALARKLVEQSATLEDWHVVRWSDGELEAIERLLGHGVSGAELVEMARMYRVRRRFDRARACLADAEKAERADAGREGGIEGERAKITWDEGHRDEALAYLRERLAATRNHAILYTLVYQLLEDDGSEIEAHNVEIATLLGAAELDLDHDLHDRELLVRRGEALMRLRRFDEARAVARRIEAWSPAEARELERKIAVGEAARSGR